MRDLINKNDLLEEFLKIPGVGNNSIALDTIKRFEPVGKSVSVIAVPQWIADNFEEHKYSWVSTVVSRIMADGRINQDGKKISESDRELEKALCVAFVTGAYTVQ